MTVAPAVLFSVTYNFIDDILHNGVYVMNEMHYNDYSYGYLEVVNSKLDGINIGDYTIPNGWNYGHFWTNPSYFDPKSFLGSAKLVPLNGTPFLTKLTPSPPNNVVSVTDCSGFVSAMVGFCDIDSFAALVQAMPTMWRNSQSNADAEPKLLVIDQKHGQPWPSAADYAYLGNELNLSGQTIGDWQVVWATNSSSAATPPQIRAGDVIAWGGLANSGDTGHVMVAMEDLAVVDGANFSLSVADSSNMPHEAPGTPDTRGSGSAFRPGAGIGPIALCFESGAWRFGFSKADNTSAWFTILRLGGN